MMSHESAFCTTIRNVNEDTFSQWLDRELEERSWTQNELARRAGISSGTLSNLKTGVRGRGQESVRAIAEALGLPPEVVFRRAGLLPEVTRVENELAEFNHILGELDEERLP